jgi:hypothetical protein
MLQWLNERNNERRNDGINKEIMGAIMSKPDQSKRKSVYDFCTIYKHKLKVQCVSKIYLPYKVGISDALKIIT